MTNSTDGGRGVAGADGDRGVVGAGGDGAHPVVGTTFGARLDQLVRERRTALCVGIDPHPGLLQAWGLPVDVQGLAEFSRRCVEAFGPRLAVVKPQVAFFEAFGSRGFAVLEETIGGLREQGALVIADAKRGDIGSTVAGYARAWLTPGSPLESDALTVAPYMGLGALQPVLDAVAEYGKGVFVLSATSNPEARAVQESTVPSTGETLADFIAHQCRDLNRAQMDATGAALGSYGIVVGATLETPPALSDFAGPVLMPGVGAQGATVKDVKALTEGSSVLALPAVSRAVLGAGPTLESLVEAIESFVADEA